MKFKHHDGTIVETTSGPEAHLLRARGFVEVNARTRRDSNKQNRSTAKRKQPRS